jgi:DNA polymerase III subunit epsilon
MPARRSLARLFAIVAAAAVALTVALAVLLHANPPVSPLTTFTVGAAGIVLAAAFALWRIVDARLLSALALLAAEARLLAHGSGAGRVGTERYEQLAPLPEVIDGLAERLEGARRETERAIADATARVEDQKSWLAAVLRDLSEGILVCNLSHQVLLYNQTALALLQVSGDLGLGRSLLQLVTPEPVKHTLERLTLRVREERHLGDAGGLTAPLVAGTADRRSLLLGRMALILREDREVSGYVLTLADATADLAALGKRDALLREVTQGFRAPLANLRAAAETLAAHADLVPAEREEFEHVILNESAVLSDRLERMSAEYRDVIAGSWPMDDIHSGNLISCVSEPAGVGGLPAVTMVGLPQWLHGDSFSLVLLFRALLRRLGETTGCAAFDMSAEPDRSWIFIDVAWPGEPVPSATLDRWLAEPLGDALGGLTVGDVLQRHRSDAWSERAGDGIARLRVPLPPAQEPHGPRRAAPPSRPEFFDFDLLWQPLASGELGRTPLRQLTYVVFDTETTGLRPSEGDEMISIAGVRIVNGRILTGETFRALINPGRSIPAASVRFHGITDEAVRDQPPAEVVLPQFRAFVGEAVLIAHNAAFDLAFLKKQQKRAGVRFDVPVLDTMLLSRQLQGDEGDHSLDGIAARLGVQIVDRHTALGDALLTAAIFLRFLDMLEERGVRTLDDAIRSSNVAAELRARERAF